MRWLRRLVIALPLLAVVLATGLVLAPNLLKPMLESAAQRTLGRPVRMGDLVLMPAWPPALQARDVAVEGVGKVARVQVVMAPGSLLSRHPQVLTLRLFGPDVAVANRLPLAAVRRVAAPAAAVSADLPAAAAARPGPSIGRVEIANGHLSWTMPPFALDLAVSGTATPETMDLAGHGTLAVGSAHVPVALHISGDPRTSLAVDGTAANATVAARLRMPGEPLDLDLAVATPDAAAFGAATGLRYLPHGAIKAQAHLAEPARALAERVVLDRFAVQDDAGNLAGALTVSYGGRVLVRGTLASQHLDLAALLAPFRAPAAAKQPAASAVSAPAGSAQPSTLLPDRRFTVPGGFDADLQVAAADTDWGSAQLGAVAGRVVLHQARLILDPFSVTPPGGGPIAAVLRLGGTEPAGLTLHAPSVPLQPLLAAAGLPAMVSGNAALEADLRARGDTLHQLAASLDGHALLRGTDLDMDSEVLAALLQASRLKLPASLLRPRTKLRCVAVGFDAQQGVLSLAPLVANADTLRIEGAGTVDLATETLALRLRPLLRAGPGLVVPVRVDGPLRAPHLAPDTGERLAASAVQTGSSGCAETAPGKLPKPAELLRRLLR